MKDVISISKKLIYTQPFYGSVLLALQKEINNSIPTAGVGLNGVNYKLYINENFWNSLSEDHKFGLLIHELGHIVHFHLTEYKHLKDPELANIAKDIYINQTIDEKYLPPGGCTWEKFNVPKGKDTNYYYKRLLQDKEDGDSKNLNEALKAMSKGEGSFTTNDGQQVNLPNHEWEEIDSASDALKKIVQKNTIQLVKTITELVSKSSPGSVPGSVMELLKSLSVIEPPKFNWRAYLKRFVGTSTKTWVTKTRRKKSKRFTQMPGLKEKTFSKILVAIDSSLSVSKSDLIEFHKELVHMYKTGNDIDIVVADTEIRDQFKFNPRKPLEIKGRGGTIFQPVIDLYNKNLKKYSCLIYLTDGEASTPVGCRGNILWVHGTEHSINESLPGKKVKLN